MNLLINLLNKNGNFSMDLPILQSGRTVLNFRGNATGTAYQIIEQGGKLETYNIGGSLAVPVVNTLEANARNEQHIVNELIARETANVNTPFIPKELYEQVLLMPKELLKDAQVMVINETKGIKDLLSASDVIKIYEAQDPENECDCLTCRARSRYGVDVDNLIGEVVEKAIDEFKNSLIGVAETTFTKYNAGDHTVINELNGNMLKAEITKSEKHFSIKFSDLFNTEEPHFVTKALTGNETEDTKAIRELIAKNFLNKLFKQSAKSI